MGTPPKLLYQQLEALDPLFVGEIVEGQLIVSPRPASPHAYAQIELAVALVPRFMHGEDRPGGWWILSEPELHLGEDVLVPDLAAWRKERMPVLEACASFDVAPDWICEILSPSNRIVDREKKMPRYLAYGVADAWLIDPMARTLEPFRSESGAWHPGEVVRGDAEMRVAPFTELPLRLRNLWLPKS